MTQESTIEEYAPVSLDVLGSKRPTEVLRLKYDVAHIMDAVLKGPTPDHPAGVHYGPSFPGSKKNSLLLPGAHTLSSTFGVTPRYDIVEIPEGKGRRYQIKASMFSRSGLFLGEGIGEASTEEEKFAWQEVVCDAQYEAADSLDVRIKYKKDTQAAAGYVEIKQIRTSVADKSNTVLKIAKKRAFVDGVILVLDCSDIFDQDFEELGDELGFERAASTNKEAKQPKPKPAPFIPYGKHKTDADGNAQRINNPMVPLDYLQWLADKTKSGLQDVAADSKHARAKFAAQDQLFLAALDAEIAARKAAQSPSVVPPVENPSQSPANPSQAAPGDVQTGKPGVATPPTSPGARQPFTDVAWAEFIRYWEEDWFDLYATTKEVYHVQSGHELPAVQRFSFYDQINAAITTAQQAKK
jgi:hypothetical protein